MRVRSTSTIVALAAASAVLGASAGFASAAVSGGGVLAPRADPGPVGFAVTTYTTPPPKGVSAQDHGGRHYIRLGGSDYANAITVDLDESGKNFIIGGDERGSATGSCENVGPRRISCPVGDTDGFIVELNGGDDDLDISERIALANGIDGGGGDDTVRGASATDFVDGRGGDDTLLGRAGPDVLMGSGGSDVLRGGPGDDVLRGDGGRDELAGGAGRDDVRQD